MMMMMIRLPFLSSIVTVSLTSFIKNRTSFIVDTSRSNSSNSSDVGDVGDVGDVVGDVGDDDVDDID